MKIQISALISKAVLLLMIITASFLMPFNVHADTITNSNVLGINTVLLSKSQNVAVTNSWYYVYQHTITLDADYIGTINLDINLSYYSAVSGGSSSVSVSSINNKSYFVNGNTIVINQTVTSDNYLNQGPIVSSSYLLKSSNVVKTSTITELQQIIDLLTDIYNSQDQVEGLLNNQLTQLQQIVANTSLANTYLNDISLLRNYDFPIESFNVVYQMFYRNIDIQNKFKLNYWDYPVFNVKAGDVVFTKNIPNGRTILYMCYQVQTINNNTTLANNFSVNEGLTFELQSGTLLSSSPALRKVVMKVTNNTGSSVYCNITAVTNNTYFIPIYGIFDDQIIGDYSTDFALQFGLSNRLLEDLDIIANGTTQSNQQSSDLSSGTDSMQDQMDDLVGIEDSYNQQFNNSVNSIDFSNPLQQNQGLLGASNFVITVFNGLIANNPFSILIIIVCILLIGKKVIGK